MTGSASNRRQRERKASKVSVKTSVGEPGKRTRVPSPQELALLKLFIANPKKWSYGYELSQLLTDVEHPTVYNILIRLHKNGYLESQWDIESEGRPRHQYRLTPQGVMYAAKRFANAPSKAREEAERLVV